MPLQTPPNWFLRELRLIDPEITVKFNDRQWKWIAYNADGSVYARIENKDKSYRPLDGRFLRKLRIDTYFTHDSKAYDALIAEDCHALQVHLQGGRERVIDYLAGYWD